MIEPLITLKVKCVPQGSIEGLLLFSISISHSFFDIIEIDIANYGDDSKSYSNDFTQENIIK